MMALSVWLLEFLLEKMDEMMSEAGPLSFKPWGTDLKYQDTIVSVAAKKSNLYRYRNTTN